MWAFLDECLAPKYKFVSAIRLPADTMSKILTYLALIDNRVKLLMQTNKQYDGIS